MTLRALAMAMLGALAFPAFAGCAELPPRIVMMWQVTGKDYAESFRELKLMGVNTAQSFALADSDPGYVDGYFEAARESGIGVVAFIGKFIEKSGGACALSEAGQAFVRAHAAKPALLAWHTVDEPVNDGFTKECQRQVYQQVKSLDPRHAVMVSVNFTKQHEYDQYFDEAAFDILDLHRYVNPSVGPAQQRLVDAFKQNRKRRDYRVIVTLRAFEAPGKIRRQHMASRTLEDQYQYFFVANGVGKDIGFYGWRLAPNLGISQIDWLKTEFGHFAQEKLDAKPK